MHRVSLLASEGMRLQLIKGCAQADHYPIQLKVDVALRYDGHPPSMRWDRDLLMGCVLRGALSPDL
eukprot:4986694-Alexandrium_andersonii.AAC.1